MIKFMLYYISKFIFLILLKIDFRKNILQDFKDLNLSQKLDDDSSLFEAISKFPKLMERPIVVNGDIARIGRPPEKILEII